MRILSIVSAKGGVGKSTVCANLAVALSKKGYQVLVADTDPQNGLRYHFGLASMGVDGLAHAVSGQTNVRDLIGLTDSGVALLPYGDANETVRRAFEQVLIDNPEWLKDTLQALDLDSNVLVLLDVPPGPSVYMSQALRAANLALTVVLPDAGSYATVPQMQGLIEQYCIGRNDFIDYGYLVNQVDRTRELSRDVLEVLKVSLGSRLVAQVHLDQAVGEALAYGQSVLDYSPYSEATRDFIACAQWVERCLLDEGKQ